MQAKHNLTTLELSPLAPQECPSSRTQWVQACQIPHGSGMVQPLLSHRCDFQKLTILLLTHSASLPWLPANQDPSIMVCWQGPEVLLHIIPMPKEKMMTWSRLLGPFWLRMRPGHTGSSMTTS